MDRRMNWFMDGWMNRWMGGPMHRYMDALTSRCMDGPIGRCPPSVPAHAKVCDLSSKTPSIIARGSQQNVRGLEVAVHNVDLVKVLHRR